MIATKLLRQAAQRAGYSCRILQARTQHLPRPDWNAPGLLPARFVATMAVEKVQPQVAAEMVEAGWTYLDVRTPQEFAAGHAPGSINIPLLLRTPAGMEPNATFMDDVLKQFPDKDTQLLVGCKAGNRSARACGMLEQHYANLADQTGGWDGWSAAKLPVSK